VVDALVEAFCSRTNGDSFRTAGASQLLQRGWELGNFEGPQNATPLFSARLNSQVSAPRQSAGHQRTSLTDCRATSAKSSGRFHRKTNVPAPPNYLRCPANF
jgi:hypothetical protein